MKRSVLGAGAFMKIFLSPCPTNSLAVSHSRSYPGKSSHFFPLIRIGINCSTTIFCAIAVPKRFYRHVDVISSGNNSYEIVLDSSKLKTPLGNVLQISSEPLALAVAAEWDSQEHRIERSTMHLVSSDCWKNCL